MVDDWGEERRVFFGCDYLMVGGAVSVSWIECDGLPVANDIFEWPFRVDHELPIGMLRSKVS
jgi:hypothetical protein